MRTLLLAISLIIIAASNAYSKIDSTLFTSSFEKNVFQKVMDSAQVSSIDLLLAYNYNPTQATEIQKQLQTIIEGLDSKGIKSKNLKSQVKLIYKTVHENNLKKYEKNVMFNELFLAGTYNCVSGIAVYALLLDHYNIDYTVKELPTHVYLIADPGNLDIKVESTDPNQGFLIYDNKAKQGYVEFLKKNKLISETEYQTKSVSELFQEYYGDEVDITLHQLAALEYSNAGVIDFNNEKYAAAVPNFEKALIIYPSSATKFLLYNASINAMHLESLQDEFNGFHLASFVNRFSTDPANKNIGLTYYEMAVNNMIIENADKNRFNSFHQDFMSLVADSVDVEEYLQMYYGKMGYIEYTEHHYSVSLNYLNMAYMLNERDLNIKDLIKGVASEYVYTHKNDAGIIDSMDYYFTVFPFLLDDYRILNLYVLTYSNAIYYSVGDREISKALALLKRMENSISVEKLQTVDHGIVEQSYVSLAQYYSIYGNSKKASQIVGRGLHILPNSQRLTHINSSLIYTPTVSTTSKVKDNSLEDFNEKFPSCWVAKYLMDENGSEDVPANETLEISASTYAKVTFKMDGEVITGRWAYRSVSKLLYLIPENDKEDYLMFKVYRCDDILVVRLYDGKTLTEPKIYFERCE